MGRYYRNLGAERAEQGVSLSHLIWAIRAAKMNLWEFLEPEGLWENPVEIHGSLELLALLDRFFDEAICNGGGIRALPRGTRPGCAGRAFLAERPGG
jgi:hypothetical protein